MSPSYKLMTGLGALCLALSSAYGTSNADETLLLRDPDISQNHIAFVYAGDIWLADRDGKNSQRLTSNVADESGPVFSPDGQTIAYTARHNGNTDVYSIEQIPQLIGLLMEKRLRLSPPVNVLQDVRNSFSMLILKAVYRKNKWNPVCFVRNIMLTGL